MIEPSHPTSDAPCPHCGQLLFFARDPNDSSITYFFEGVEARDIPDSILNLIPSSVVHENSLVPVAEIGSALVVASVNPLSIETVEKLCFILNRPIVSILMPPHVFEQLRTRHDQL